MERPCRRGYSSGRRNDGHPFLVQAALHDHGFCNVRFSSAIIMQGWIQNFEKEGAAPSLLPQIEKKVHFRQRNRLLLVNCSAGFCLIIADLQCSGHEAGY